MVDVINYNGLMRIMYNLKDSVAFISDFKNWSEYEFDQINHLKEYANKYNLKSTLIIPIYNNEYEGIWNNKNIINLANKSNIDQIVFLYVNHFLKELDEEQLFLRLSKELSIKKILSSKNYEFKYWKTLNVDFFKKHWQNNFLECKNLKSFKKVEELFTLISHNDFKTFKMQTGLDYQLSGIVADGKKYGRTIGYPTINIIVDSKIPLKFGVYAVKVYVEALDKTYLGSCMYWKNSLNQILLETYILDFDKDIYGWKVDLIFLKKIRNGIKVDSVDHLKNLIKNDVEETKKIKL
ncbi:riboflavin kinase/FAD synthetase [Spiroplasma gladiatoris]|uniref:riboflavin kinase n=1 Tax=Spiroplasma gladiatoris TaxID=2143 RepID=A0A4P7AIV4_9MOLU|nr:riboflavin kinase [Spiroplasma gladiatoris]QBQ07698.1 riboflavin kinase/FAD synthetase [Spiroplasma gladiatoris]